MRNRLKGVTLIETMLYIGLFSIVILIVLNFMLSTQESTQRTDNRLEMYRSSELVTEHIEYSFNKALAVNEANCVFGNNQGVLEIEFLDGNKQYYTQDLRLYYDGIPITPSTISVSSFLLEPLYKDALVIGVRIHIDLVSNSDVGITDTINLLSIIR